MLSKKKDERGLLIKLAVSRFVASTVLLCLNCSDVVFVLHYACYTLQDASLEIDKVVPDKLAVGHQVNTLDYFFIM